MKYLTLTCLLIVALVLIFGSSTPESPSPLVKDSRMQKHADNIYRLISVGKYDLADSNIDSAIRSLEHGPVSNSSMLAWLYEMKAQVMASRYHYHHAIAALSKAQQYEDKPRLKEQKRELQQRINSMQTERQLRESYQNGRDAGVARVLTQQVNIAYIYIDDNASSKWSGKQRLKNQVSVERVTDWYQTQASRYSIDNINFKVRYFVVRSPKGITKQWLRSREAFNQVLNPLIKRLHFKNVDEFIDNIAAGNKDAQVAIVFHSNYQGRSFAMSCPGSRTPNRCKYEYVMLTEKMNNNHFSWALPQIQAHEVLHLFGAKDLYNIKAAKNYAVTDLMNYYSKDLKYATIEPLSAWAIGWQPQQPTPPFKIEN